MTENVSPFRLIERQVLLRNLIEIRNILEFNVITFQLIYPVVCVPAPLENVSAQRSRPDSPEKLLTDRVAIYPQHTIFPQRTRI